MRFSSVIAASAFAGAALAADHVVVVGKDKNLFVPAVTEAAEGDTVTFKFWPKNHSIAQGPFDKPCQPVDGGFWSGYVPTSDTAAAATTTFMVTVKNASQPLWFYCTQASHCQGGMVGVINPPKTGNRTIEAYASGAGNATANVQPASKGTDNLGNGMIMPNGTMNGTDDKGSAATSVSVNSGMAFASFLGLMTYLLL